MCIYASRIYFSLREPLLARYLLVTIYFKVAMCHKWLFLPYQIGPDLSNFTHCSMSLSHFLQFTSCNEVSFASFKTILFFQTFPILESLTLVCINIFPACLICLNSCPQFCPVNFWGRGLLGVYHIRGKGGICEQGTRNYESSMTSFDTFNF